VHIVHSLFTNDIGGTERHVADLANAQIASGHRVSLIIRANRGARHQNDSLITWLAPQVEVVELPGYWPVSRWPYWPVRHALSRLKPDIIHTHHGRDSRYLARAARQKTPVIATLHIRYRVRDYHRHDGIICVSPWQLETVPQAARAHRVMIPNWAEAVTQPSLPNRAECRQQLGLAEDTFLFGFVGRLSAEKGPQDLITAFAQANLPQSHLVLLGDGELYPELQAQIAANPSISLMGYTPDIRPWYEAMDGFVLPSRTESFGLVLLEAMDAGLPILATQTNGAHDLLRQNPHSILVETANVDALSTGLARLKTTPPFTRVTHDTHQHYTLRHANEATLAFYQTFLSR